VYHAVAERAHWSLVVDTLAMTGLLAAVLLVVNRHPSGRLLSITIWSIYLLLEVCDGLFLALDPNVVFEPLTFAAVPIVLLAALIGGTSMVRLR
jgi:hypothetical protein